jgi:hypothetical protein
MVQYSLMKIRQSHLCILLGSKTSRVPLSGNCTKKDSKEKFQADPRPDANVLPGKRQCLGNARKVQEKGMMHRSGKHIRDGEASCRQLVNKIERDIARSYCL